jgi:hypothetical protein
MNPTQNGMRRLKIADIDRQMKRRLPISEEQGLKKIGISDIYKNPWGKLTPGQGGSAL